MRLDLAQAQFVARELLRPGEGEAVREAISPNFTSPDIERRRTEAWEGLLSRRFEILVGLTDFDDLPAGWLFAAVRLHGERAPEALRALGKRRDWPGREDAEAALGRCLPS